MAVRAHHVLAAYECARSTGLLSDRDAKRRVIAQLTRAPYAWRLSESEVSRILKQYQPVGRREVFRARIVNLLSLDQAKVLGLARPGGRFPRQVLALTVGPRPTYARPRRKALAVSKKFSPRA
jgi:hypothetical protein